MSALSATPPYHLQQAQAHAFPLIVASSHSGRHYPLDFLEQAHLDAFSLRRSEDAYVDVLLGNAPMLGCALLTANYARAYVDINRDPQELDSRMFRDIPADFLCMHSERVQAGLGVIPKIVGQGLNIYQQKISFAEAQARIMGVYMPYHQALRQLLEDMRAAHGYAVLLDWHSMPSTATAGFGARRPQIVVGDRCGQACAPALRALVVEKFRALGYRVLENEPYAGGYTTATYGNPGQGWHVLQIEISRSVYLDELRIVPHAGHARLQENIMTVLAHLAKKLNMMAL
jgi:N-formylglutamate amidohydrolase